MRTVALAALALSPVVLAGCFHGEFGPSDRYQEDFHHSGVLNPGGRVNIESFNGSIEITGWDENKVEVRGVKYASTEDARDRIRIDVGNHSDGDSFDLRVLKPSTRFGNAGARFVVHVPRTALLDRITTSNGSIRIRDVASAAHLRTSNSSIRAENVAGGVEARTSNGSIEMDGIRGPVTLRTSNSRIRAQDVEGSFDADTSNGSVDLELRKQPASDIVAHTSNGGITVRLPPSLNARVDASTSNSEVRTDFDLVGRFDEHKRHASGTIGGGGPLLRLETSNGGVRILKGTGE